MPGEDEDCLKNDDAGDVPLDVDSIQLKSFFFRTTDDDLFLLLRFPVCATVK